MMTFKARFIWTTELKVGDRTAGGVVESIRVSKSGKTVFITERKVDDSLFTFDQSAGTRIAVFRDS